MTPRPTVQPPISKTVRDAATCARLRPGWRALPGLGAVIGALLLAGPTQAVAATPPPTPASVAASDPCAAQESALKTVHAQIAAHNAEPHQFELPAQSAALQAYDTQAEQLTDEQTSDITALRSCQARSIAPRAAVPPSVQEPAPAISQNPAGGLVSANPRAGAPAATAPKQAPRQPPRQGPGTPSAAAPGSPRTTTPPDSPNDGIAPSGATAPSGASSSSSGQASNSATGAGTTTSSGSEAETPTPSTTTPSTASAPAQTPAERTAVAMFRATLAKGSAIFPYTPQELTDLTEAIDALPERGVWFSRDLEVLPPTLEQAARVLEQFQARALAGHATSTLHGTAAPGGGAHPRPVMTVRELLRRVPGLLQADPATVLAVVGSPLNAYWPGSNVDAAAVLETLQTGLDQIRLASPDGPGHKLLLGPGPRGTNNETIYFNRHPDAEDLNELLDSFPCLDALIPASHDSNQDEDQRDAAPPSFVSLKTHIGDNAIAAYLLDIRKVIADHGGCASKAAAKFADLEETGRSPLHGTCAQDVVACIRDHGSVGVPTDQVEQVRDALVAELTSSKHALYGLSTPPTPAQARDYAKQWISDTGYPISLTQFA